MSDTIWVDVEGRTEEELPSDNSIMLRLKNELDALCQELGVIRLSSFYDYSEVAANYYDSVDSADSRQSESWFDPVPALRAVQAISAFLSRSPESLDFGENRRGMHWRPALIRELENCESTLKQALATGRKFRLLIVP